MDNYLHAGENRTTAASEIYPYNAILEQQSKVTGTANAQIAGEKQGWWLGRFVSRFTSWAVLKELAEPCKKDT